MYCKKYIESDDSRRLEMGHVNFTKYSVGDAIVRQEQCKASRVTMQI